MASPWEISSHWVWSSLHLSLEYESLRRCHHNHPLLGTSDPPIFDAGEIAYAPDGQLAEAYYQFLEARGYELSARERAIRASASVARIGGAGKFCLVVDRVGEDAHWVCYLSTFASAGDTSKIAAPFARYFGLAFGDVRPWPPDFEGVQTVPKWNRKGYIVAMPVLRYGPLQTVRRWSNSVHRFMVKAGELERIRTQIIRKVQEFPNIADKLREEQTKWALVAQRGGGAGRLRWYDIEGEEAHTSSATPEEFANSEDADLIPASTSPRRAESQSTNELKESSTQKTDALTSPSNHSFSHASSPQASKPAPFIHPSPAQRLALSPRLTHPWDASILTHLCTYLPHDIIHNYRALSMTAEGTARPRPRRRGQKNWENFKRSVALLDRVKSGTVESPAPQAHQNSERFGGGMVGTLWEGRAPTRLHVPTRRSAQHAGQPVRLKDGGGDRRMSSTLARPVMPCPSHARTFHTVASRLVRL